MSRYPETEFSRNFHRQLAELHQRVGATPREHRATLHRFVRLVDRQHCQMQDNCASVRAIVDDLSLLVESTKFNLWAMQHEFK